MTLFHQIIETRVEDPRGTITPLIEYTKGGAREIIKHCVHQPPTHDFRNTKVLLERKYGNS